MKSVQTKSLDECIAENIADRHGFDLIYRLVLWKLGKGDFGLADLDTRLDDFLQSEKEVNSGDRDADLGDSIRSAEKDERAS